MAYLIDSSVWIALFLDFDTQHKKAVRLFSALHGMVYMPYCILVEVATVLAYKHSKQQADSFLAYIEHNHDIVVLDDNPQDEIAFYKTLSHKISFTDGALILLSQKFGAKLLTFDKQLVRIAKKQ